MAVNYRILDGTNSHERYNQHVKIGQTVFEISRSGSDFHNLDSAIATISAYLDFGKSYSLDFGEIRSENLAINGINYGTRILRNRAIVLAIRKPSKSADHAREIVEKHLPRLIGN